MELFEFVKRIEPLIGHVKYSVTYADSPSSFTLPSILTKERWERLNDHSIKEIKLIYQAR